jgi:cytochrome b involved in lipid metabolism
MMAPDSGASNNLILPEFSEAEVAAHCTSDDCWVIVAGAVFDVTHYLDKHPGLYVLD